MNEHDFDLSYAAWRTASYTNGNGACVEVADLDSGHRAVRDSKDRTGPVLMVTPAEWTAFIADIRTGGFG